MCNFRINFRNIFGISFLLLPLILFIIHNNNNNNRDGVGRVQTVSPVKPKQCLVLPSSRTELMTHAKFVATNLANGDIAGSPSDGGILHLSESVLYSWCSPSPEDPFVMQIFVCKRANTAWNLVHSFHHHTFLHSRYFCFRYI